MKRLILLGALLLPTAAVAQQVPQPQPRTLTVSAQASVERAPDQAVLTLAVESEAANARDAARTNAAKMDRVVAALRRVGIPADKIRTVAYELQPQYTRPDKEGQPPRIAGYRAINQLQITIDAVEQVGPSLDASIEAGANRASELIFQLKDPATARLEALRLATEKAKREAQAVAQAAGETLGPALTINTDGYMPPPRAPAPMYDRAVMMEAKAMETPVQAGTLNVMASITIVYRLGA